MSEPLHNCIKVKTFDLILFMGLFQALTVDNVTVKSQRYTKFIKIYKEMH